MSNNTSLSTVNVQAKIKESMNDIFIMRPNGETAYLNYSFYADPSRIIESVTVDGEFVKRFFLSNNGVYPSNLASQAVAKVIDWNLKDTENELKVFESDKKLGDPKTGYFIDLRQLSMSRLNMIRVPGSSTVDADTPIANENLPDTANPFLLVPEDKEYQLKELPEDNVYIAFFQEPDKTHSDSHCYSYNVSYISAKELDEHLASSKSTDVEKDDSELMDVSVKYLETYYGDTKVQAGGINPNDIRPKMFGLTCYVANLRTFK